MINARVTAIVLAILAAGGAGVWAQAAPGPGGPLRRGFSSQILIAQLSLYLPEEATRAMYRGFTRDPALFLTKDQIAKLLPILQALRDAPLPTPSKAKQVQAEVDAQLTAGQKAEWAEFQKKMQARIEEFRQRMAASGGGAPGMTDGGADGGPGASAREQAGGSPSGTLLQRRQRQLDAFIEVLRIRLKQ